VLLLKAIPTFDKHSQESEMENSSTVKTKLGAYQVRLVALHYGIMGFIVTVPGLMLSSGFGGLPAFSDQGAFVFYAPFILLIAVFVIPSIFLLRGSPWARYALIILAVLLMRFWINEYFIQPIKYRTDITITLPDVLWILPNIACIYVLIFSKSFRKEIDQRSGRTPTWKNFPIFVTVIIFFTVMSMGISAYRSWQSSLKAQNDFISMFAFIKECYPQEVQLMEKIYSEMPYQVQSFDNGYEFNKEWIDSYSLIVQSMRFKDLRMWLSGSPPNTAARLANIKHDFFPDYNDRDAGSLLISEDERIFIGHRGDIFYLHHKSKSLLYQVHAELDTKDIENCGGKAKTGPSD
jgi:hypothetical protein